MEIEVKGHSGCPINIVRENNNLFIYKSSYDRKYLDRLIRQADKQLEAGKQEYQHIRIPEIFDIVRDDDHVTIKMEYVYSRNFIEYFESAGFEQIDYFIKALILFIEKELEVSPVQLIQTQITLNKFEDVKEKILSNPLLTNDEETRKIIHASEKRFMELAKHKTIKIPLGRCHGDLTFSNILFNGNNYYLIDFLDSFIESPLMDIVKIRQDSFHFWSQLMYIKQFDKLRLKIICEKIDDRIDNYFKKYDWYREYYFYYQLLNLLRILQYAKEKEVIGFLKKELNDILTSNIEKRKEVIQSNNPCKDKNLSLIVPAAADTTNSQIMPYVFSLDQSGIMICIRSVLGLNLNAFDKIYFTILRKHVDQFCLDEIFSLQFKRLGIKNARLVILENSTKSQTETVYKTLIQERIGGGIYVKDADGYFESKIRKENSVALYSLDQLKMVDPRHKSYVSVDDNFYITNIIERKVISEYFNVGGVCFEDSRDFLDYYLNISTLTKTFCMSHLIYKMLLDNHKFRPVIAGNYIDWGNEDLFYYHKIMNR